MKNSERIRAQRSTNIRLAASYPKGSKVRQMILKNIQEFDRASPMKK